MRWRFCKWIFYQNIITNWLDQRLIVFNSFFLDNIKLRGYFHQAEYFTKWNAHLLEKSLINIKHLFTVVNDKLVNIKDWFTANKFNLNVENTKYSFFNKPSKKDDISRRLPNFIINNYEIQREKSIKLLGVLLDQHLTRTEQNILEI